VTFEHLRFRRRVALLALGVLEDLEAEGVSAHADGCSRCRRELDGVRALLDGMAGDPVARAEPALSCEALAARVQARLEEELAPRVATRWRLVAVPLAAAALIATVLLLPRLRTGLPSTSPPTVASGAPQSVSVPEELVARMERRLAREQTARYLNEAQDVLMTVATLHRHCLNEDENRAVDVQDDVQRSRDLLLRRVLLVDAAGREVAMAEPLLADVEELLRQVADLPSCARSQDLRAINRRMTEGRLLMKIDLMARELQG
jgi:hypothetical protein